MKVIFNPAIALMSSVRYPIKFAIVFMVIFMALVVAGIRLVTPINAEIALLESERVGLSYIRSVRLPMESIQQHRGMMAAYFDGATEFRERFMEKRRVVDKALEQLKLKDTELGEQLETKGLVNDLFDQWNRIKKSNLDTGKSETVAAHTDMINDMLALIVTVADSSQITLDPKLDSY